MKKIILSLFILYYYFKSNNTYADILWNNWSMSSWDVTFYDIPNMISHAIEVFMWLAWTVSIIFIIFGSYQIMYGSTSWDKSKWRNTVIAAIWGFILAALWYVIVNFIIDNFQ